MGRAKTYEVFEYEGWFERFDYVVCKCDRLLIGHLFSLGVLVIFKLILSVFVVWVAVLLEVGALILVHLLEVFAIKIINDYFNSLI